MAIDKPHELLELADGGFIQTRVDRFEVGEMDISPRDGRPPKTIKAIRIHVPPADKPFFPFYWDLTAGTLVAQMEPMLPGIVQRKAVLKITKRGTGPSARFSVEVR